MIAVVTRVKSCKVSVEGKLPSAIGSGYLVYVGVADTDTSADAVKLGKKLPKLRLMADKNGKLNLDLPASGGELMLVSQFTLIANVGSGNRPSFAHAAKGERALSLFNELVATARKNLKTVKTGFFGEYMAVESINDGPVTLVLDTRKF